MIKPGYLGQTNHISGAEIARLLLAIIPLMVSLLEYYQTCSEKLANKHVHVRNIEGFKRDIGLEGTKYQHTLGRVFEHTVTPRELRTLMLQFNDPLWKDPTIQLKIREFLDSAYEPFYEALTSFYDTVANLYSDLSSVRFEKVSMAQVLYHKDQ